MTVEVKYLRDALPGLVDWRHSLGRTESERADAVHYAEFENLLIAHRGRPPGARRHDESDRAVWWLDYADRLTVRYVLGERPPRPRGWWDVRRWVARLVTPPALVVTVIGVSVGGSSAGRSPPS